MFHHGSAPQCSPVWCLLPVQVLLQDCYFTSSQAGQIVAAFSYGEDKVEAAVKVRRVDGGTPVLRIYSTLLTTGLWMRQNSRKPSTSACC